MKNLAVFFDADNINYKDIPWIMKEVKSLGNVIIIRAYADWSKLKNWNIQCSKHGIEPIQCNRLSGKNSSDIKLCCDLLQLLYQNPVIQEFCIVTTDADYIHVISKIRQTGKNVNVIGSKRANDALKSSCDKFVEIEVLKNDNVKNKVSPALLRTVEDMLASYDDRINLSLIKDNLIKRCQFDQRAYGYRSFSDFFKKHFGKNYRIISGKNGMYVISRDVNQRL